MVMKYARSFKSHSHLFLISYFWVQTSIFFTLMVNARKHGMFGQNRNKFWLPNNCISSLPSVARTNLRAYFALLKSYTHKLALYMGC